MRLAPTIIFILHPSALILDLRPHPHCKKSTQSFNPFGLISVIALGGVTAIGLRLR